MKLTEIKHCGVYFLINDGVITYIGQSTDWHARMMVHKNQLMPFEKARLIECDADKLDYYEKRWIKKFKPVYNKTGQGRKKKYKKMGPPPPKYKSRNMHFRKLTEKSYVGFGKHKNEKVSRLIELGKTGDLVQIYYSLSHITFMDSVLDALGITPEWRIEKPGVDKEKLYTFCNACLPEFVEYKKKMYEKIAKKRAGSVLKNESRLNHNKQLLQNKNMGRGSF